jgi:hypothetical protein
MDKLDTKKKVLIGLLFIALAFGAGFFAKPAKIVTQTTEVVKTVTVTQEAKVKVVYRTVVTAPDGTKTETESSREDTNTNTNAASESVKTAKSEVTNDVGLTLSALTLVDSSDIKGHRDYGIHITKRVLGNVNVGVLATLDKKVGVSLGVEF